MLFVSRELNKNQLPTKSDVIKHLLFLREKNNNRSYGLSNYHQKMLNDLSKIWKRAEIPVISKTAIRKKLQNLTLLYWDITKNPSHCNASEWAELFSISVCKCALKIKVSCSCPGEKQMPLHVWNFYLDQSSRRLLTLDDVENHIPCDSITDFESESENESIATATFVPQLREMDVDDPYSSSSEEDLKDLGPSVQSISLPTFSAALDRASVSNRFGALLATTLLKDLDIPGLIIDQHKIQRERTKARAKSLRDIKNNEILKCISFDGKRERTLKQVTVNGKPRNVKMMEEHITLVSEPSSNYIGYLTPVDGSGAGIANDIVNYLKAEKFSLEHVVAVNCDGTSANTGKFNGAICNLERQLQRPLQWLICLFHFNELPFTALLKEMLGKANGPQNWPGIIGHTLQGCEDVPIAHNFDPIAMGYMPTNIDDWVLRADQKYLYDMVRAVDAGACDEHLASIKPGPLNLSRWLTTASRILRLYVTKPVACEKLKQLAFFVMRVYAPFWFLIKSQPKAIHGSRHLYKYIEWTRELPADMQFIVQRSVQINGFFAHPENILLAMVTDESKATRKEAYDIILQSRAHDTQGIRQFNVPKIQFNCDSYKNMIDWNELRANTELPCIQFYTQQYLLELHDSNEIVKIPEFPCHSQNTERFVHVVSQSCVSVIDKNRPAHIANKIQSRKRCCKIESRKDLE